MLFRSQVHPDDEYAWKYEHSFGKTELWYILTAKQDSKLVFGFRRNMSREQVETAIREKRIEDDLNHISVHKNEVFFVEAEQFMRSERESFWQKSRKIAM